jgi:hypothetical protein
VRAGTSNPGSGVRLDVFEVIPIMTRPNDACTSITCTLAPLRIRHYRWQCGSDTFDRPTLQAAQRSAAALSKGVRDRLAKPNNGQG